MWVVHGAAKDATRSGRTVAREAVQSAGFDTQAAHSRALARVSADIAATIRTVAAGRPES